MYMPACFTDFDDSIYKMADIICGLFWKSSNEIMYEFGLKIRDTAHARYIEFLPHRISEKAESLARNFLPFLRIGGKKIPGLPATKIRRNDDLPRFRKTF